MPAHGAPVTIGSLLGQTAAKKGVSHDQAGYEIGVSQATFSRWAAGENLPAFAYWTKIARFLGVPRDKVAELAASERLARGASGRGDRITQPRVPSAKGKLTTR